MPFTPLDEEVVDTPIRKGFTPFQDIQQEDISSVEDAPISKGFTPRTETSATKAFTKKAIEEVVPATAALSAFATGAEGGAALGALGGPVAPITVPLFTLLGGLTASLGVGYVTHKAQESITKDIPKGFKEAIGMDKGTRKQEEEEHPYASFAGQLAPNLLTFRPGSLETVKMAGREVGPWAQRMLLGGAGAGFEIGTEEYNGEKLDPTKIAMSAVFQGVAATPTKLGEKVMNSLTPKKAPVIDPGSEEWVSKDLKERWQLPTEVNGIPVKVGTIINSPNPNSIVGAGYRNRDTGEVLSTGLNHSKSLDEGSLPLDQGFITYGGEFKTRAEAAEIAQTLHGDKLKRPMASYDELHTKDFGDKGLEALGKPEEFPALNQDGTPVLGRLYRNADNSPKEIHLNKDSIVDAFVSRQWTKQKDPNIKPLIRDQFKTPGEMVQFVFLHEEAHSRIPQVEGQSHADYENLINIEALQKFDELNNRNTIPDTNVPAMPTNNTEFDNALFTFGKSKEADNSLAAERLQAAEQEGVDLSMKEKWRQFAEGEHIVLNKRETELFNKYYAAEALERRALIKYAMDEGIILPVEMGEDVAGFNVARQLISKPMSTAEKLKETLAGNKGGFDANIEKVPGAAQERGIFALEYPNGKRIIIQAKEGVVLQWNKNKASRLVNKPDPIHAGSKIGSATVKEAKISEIETESPFRYNKDSQAVLYKRLTELRELVRAHEFIKNFKETEFFAKNAVKMEAGKNPPEGYQALTSTDKIPALRDYAFTPRVAEIIDDFSKVWGENALTLISGTLIKNMMLNPIPHMLNEAWHLYNARGLTGWVSPVGIKRFVKSGFPALKEVLNQGPEFRSMLKYGASLLSTDVRNSAIQEGFFKRGAKEFIDTPEGVKLAKDYGVSPLELYNRLSKQSSIAMWVVRDAMYMQQIKEKMMFEGMSQKQAIAEVERHMPNYRINARVGEKILGGSLSRSLSKTLQNPRVSVFSRYHYGMVNSLVATGTDIAKLYKAKNLGDIEKGLKGVDQAAAIAVAISVLYPLQDMLAQYLTGNKNAEQRRAGPYHIFHAISDVMEDKKDPQAILASVFTFNPALLMTAQLAFNRKLYNGQPVYNPGEVPHDLFMYFLGQMPQVQTSLAVSDDKKGGGINEWAAKQIDIMSPSEVAFRNKEEIQHRNLVAREHRARRGSE